MWGPYVGPSTPSLGTCPRGGWCAGRVENLPSKEERRNLNQTGRQSVCVWGLKATSGKESQRGKGLEKRRGHRCHMLLSESGRSGEATKHWATNLMAGSGAEARWEGTEMETGIVTGLLSFTLDRCVHGPVAAGGCGAMESFLLHPWKWPNRREDFCNYCISHVPVEARVDGVLMMSDQLLTGAGIPHPQNQDGRRRARELLRKVCVPGGGEVGQRPTGWLP